MLSILLPGGCAGCGTPGGGLCVGCVDGLRESDPVEVPDGLDSCAALLAYEGVGKRVVAGLKFRGQRGVAGLLGPAMAKLVEPSAFDSVTWALTSQRHRRRRGFDQAEVLARAVASHLDVDVRPMLRHAGGGGLTGLSRGERRGGVRFEPRTGICHRVLLVDDVVTTGTTLSAAAEALRAGGAGVVHGLALAATPRCPRR